MKLKAASQEGVSIPLELATSKNFTLIICSGFKEGYQVISLDTKSSQGWALAY